MDLVFRPYAGEDDYAALREMIKRRFADPARRFYPSLGDLDYIRYFEEGDREDGFQAKTTVCELPDGTIAGAVWPGHFRILYCVTDPDYAELEDAIFAWAEAQYAGDPLVDRPTGKETYVWAYEEDERRTAVLRARGYERHTWYMYAGSVALDGAIPEPRFPDGYRVRPIEERDLERKLAFMGVSTGHSAPGLAEYRRLMNSPTYKPELDLIVADSDDAPVAFANVWHDADHRLAVIEPFGTKESHRRMGLATNLLFACMHRLRALGVSRLYINHGGMWTLDPEPDDALRVYLKAGFQPYGRMFVWCKPARP